MVSGAPTRTKTCSGRTSTVRPPTANSGVGGLQSETVVGEHQHRDTLTHEWGCGTGRINQALEAAGEIRVTEATPHGDYQARLDLDSLALEWVGAWR
jgi:hypothetical protein